jgi:hypothetical protein
MRLARLLERAQRPRDAEIALRRVLRFDPYHAARAELARLEAARRQER